MQFLLRVFLLVCFSAFASAVFAQTESSSPVAADIREIILETGDGFCFDCERVTTLRANDAPATFRGGKKSRIRSGNFSGEFAAKDFTTIAQSFIKNGFFDLEPFYKGTTSDVATVKITVVYNNGSKMVENFKRSGEPRFKKIEQEFNQAAEKIIWQKTGETEKKKKHFRSFFGGARGSGQKLYRRATRFASRARIRRRKPGRIGGSARSFWGELSVLLCRLGF